MLERQFLHGKLQAALVDERGQSLRVLEQSDDELLHSLRQVNYFRTLCNTKVSVQSLLLNSERNDPECFKGSIKQKRTKQLSGL